MTLVLSVLHLCNKYQHRFLKRPKSLLPLRYLSACAHAQARLHLYLWESDLPRFGFGLCVHLHLLSPASIKGFEFRVSGFGASGFGFRVSGFGFSRVAIRRLDTQTQYVLIENWDMR
jgi:hypothetical protein